MAPKRTVNRERAQRLRRERSFTYAQIAEALGCSWNAAYYACNPEKRKAQTDADERRSVYVASDLWERIGVVAGESNVSRSRLLVDIVLGRRKPLGEES